ncbi:MAG: helicase-related protein, partial [Ignavibacteriales bacterium]
QFLKDPTRIEVARPATTAETIKQHLVRIPSSEPKAKRMALRALIERADVKNGIVFCNRKSEVDIVAKSLKKHGLDAAAIHGDLDQATRMRTLAAFRSGELRLLCASDVAARGLDIPDVSHVFNYDVPHHADDYVHRIGRTGRAGKSGQTFMIITPADVKNLDKVLKLIGQNPEEITLDLDWSAAKDDRPRDARDRERGRGRERGSRDRDRDRPRKDHGERASMEPAPAVEAAPVEEAPAPRPERPRREERKVEAEAPRPRREEPPMRPVRGVSKVEPREDDDRRVVGFGGDTPAFLMRATPKVSATAED